MIRLEKALKIIDDLARVTLNTERVSLNGSLGMVLAEDVYADCDFPSFDKSAMDGYAIRKEDMHNSMQIIEFIPAGKKPQKSLTPGTCAKIMTGAMVPEGAELVVMKEDVVVEGKSIRITKTSTKNNILKQGEDVSSGDLLLEKGILLTPANLGLLASVGISKPLVSTQPIISVISTGDELVAPCDKPIPPQIRNSNGAQLEALARQVNCKTIDLGQVADDRDLIFKAVEKALEKSDVVLLTGGASVGDLDFTGAVFEKLNASIHFSRLAIQPGKPVLFATISDKYLIGLSGNPVSSFVQFHLLVKPLVRKLAGASFGSKMLKLPIAQDMSRKNSERSLFFPVKINEDTEAEAIKYHGSAHLQAYQQAEAIACFPIGMSELKKGTIVNVRPI